MSSVETPGDVGEVGAASGRPVPSPRIPGEAGTPGQPGHHSHHLTTPPAGGHPKAIIPIISVALWDFVSFWGMQSILMMYMLTPTAQGGLGLAQSAGMGIMGSYMGLGFLVTIVAGWVSDRLFGSERTLLYAAVLVMLGHLGLTLLPGTLGLTLGLIGVGIGSGGIKAAGVSTLGTFYAEGDERRYSGFSLFYFGLNTGAFMGPILSGWFQGRYNFHAGFIVAAIGMAIGLLVYFPMRRLVRNEQTSRPTDPIPAGKLWQPVAALAAFIGFVALGWTQGWITPPNLARWVAGVAATAAAVYFLMILTSKQAEPHEKRRIAAYAPMWLSSVLFWSMFMQIFTVLPVLMQSGRIDFGGFLFGFKPPWIFSINPIWVIALALVFAAVWAKLDDRAPVAPLKFAMALTIMGIAFWCFVPLAGGGKGSISLYVLIGILGLFSLGEVLLSPVGMSLVTKLAPKKLRTQTVALFFLSPAIGSAMAAVIGERYTPGTEVTYFGALGATAVTFGILLVLLTKPITRLMGGVR